MNWKDFHNAHKSVIDIALFCFGWIIAECLCATIIPNQALLYLAVYIFFAVAALIVVSVW